MEITSKRHIYRFYLNLILCNILLMGFGSFLLLKGIQENKNTIILGGFFLLIIAISITYGFIKSTPKVIINKEGILVKNNYYNWDELTDSKLTGKGDMFFSSGECTTLFFNDKICIQFFDDFYSNSAEMKFFIEQIIINKEVHIENIELSKESISIDSEFFIPYKGNPIFSFRGVMMWGIILCFILLPLFSKKPINFNGLLVINSINLLFFFMFSHMMDYFEISKNILVVKNHYFFWKKQVFSIKDIREIVFEQQGKGPNTLRLILKNFEVKKYYAGSLTNETWLELKKEFESKNIAVRNHCIPEN